MSLTIVAGLPGSNARERARARVVGAVTGDRPPILVVATARYAPRCQAEALDVGPVGLHIVPIGRLVRSEWLLNGDGRRIVEGPYRDVALREALVSAGVSDRPGRGAVALLGSLVMRACARGALPVSAATGLSGRLLTAMRVYLGTLKEAGLVEESEATRSLADCPPPAKVVAVEGLTSLTPDVEAMLRGWSGAGCEVIVSLPWKRDCPATQPLDGLVERLEAAGAEIDAAPGLPDGRPPELARVATALFSGSAPRPTDGGVELGVARGEEAEARLIAERVLELIEGGTDGSDIAVAFAEPARHSGWLRRAFEDSGVDAAWDARVPVPETPLGRAMFQMWASCTAGMTREDLSAFMRSPFSGVDSGRIDAANVRWRRLRVTGPALLGEADRARPLLHMCSRLAGRPIDRATARDWKQLADSLFANAYGHDAPLPGMDGALDAAVHRAFCQALVAAAEHAPRVAARDLWEAFGNARVSPAASDAPGRVTVTSFEGLAGRVFSAVIIGGLTAGETPPQGSDDRLEGDAVRGALAALAIALDPDEHAREERLAFYLVVTAATGSLTLVRRDADEEGRPLRPSVYWEEFLDLYREPGEHDPPGLPPLRTRDLGEGSATVGARGVRRGVLADPVVLASLGEIGAVSPGEVELYAGCPYRWFVERKLRPKRPDTEVDVMVAGLAAHKALASFYREWTADPTRPRVTPGNLDEALTLARIAVDRALAESPDPSTLDEQWLLQAVAPSVLGLVGRDASFLPDYVPTEFEWSFGIEEGDEPVDLGGVAIKGRADRIDVGPQGLVVIDYKRSRARSHAEIEREGLVQLQLYALAASARLGLPVAGGVYRSLATPTDRGFVSGDVAGAFVGTDVVAAATIESLLGKAVDTARAAFEGMRAGVITPAPEARRCAYCSALGFCPEGLRS